MFSLTLTLLVLSAAQVILSASTLVKDLVPPAAPVEPVSPDTTSHKIADTSVKQPALKYGKYLKVKPTKISAPDIDAVIGAQGFLGLGQRVEAKVLPVGRPASEVAPSLPEGVEERVLVPLRRGSGVVLVSLPGIVDGPYLGPQVGFHVERRVVEPTKKPLKKPIQ